MTVNTKFHDFCARQHYPWLWKGKQHVIHNWKHLKILYVSSHENNLFWHDHFPSASKNLRALKQSEESNVYCAHIKTAHTRLWFDFAQICERRYTKEKQWQRNTQFRSQPSPAHPPPPFTPIKMREVMPLDHTDRRTTNSCNLWDTENQ